MSLKSACRFCILKSHPSIPSVLWSPGSRRLEILRFPLSGKKQPLCFKVHEIDITTYKGKQRKDKIARNLVDYEAGRTIFETVLGNNPNHSKSWNL